MPAASSSSATRRGGAFLLSTTFAAVAALLDRDALRRELDEEMAFHMEQLAQDLAPLLIQVAEGFVGQDGPWPIHEGTRHRHPLLLAPREVSGGAFATILEYGEEVEVRLELRLLADAAIIGAATTVTAIEESLDLARHLPLLPAVANRLACPQIRNMATIGGNVCNASPAGDLSYPE